MIHLGISNGINPLFDSFEWLEEQGIVDIYLAGIIDNLHTLYKGEVELVIGWTLTTIWVAADKSDAVLAKLDQRIKDNSYYQSLDPFSKRRKFIDGISGYFKATKLQPSALEKSVMTGGLTSQEMTDLLFWLLIAIGTKSDFLPNREIFKGMNPLKIVTECISSVLELTWRLKVKKMPTSHLASLQNLTNECVARIQQLLLLKQKYLKSKRTSMNSWKPHGITHVPMQVRLY
jgi:hypothetical protein